MRIPQRVRSHRSFRRVLLAASVVAATVFSSQSFIKADGSVPLIGTGPYTQNFDTPLGLANSGPASMLPLGWSFVETGTNANGTYSAGFGNSLTGDTYSFGASGIPPSTERAFGQFRTGSVSTTIGATFSNAGLTSIPSVTIAYKGEQWRLGVAGREDRMDFQYCLDAPDLNTCPSDSWIDVNALDYISQVRSGSAGSALNGNNNAILVGPFTIDGLDLQPGHTLTIRWLDFDAVSPTTGANVADDGMAIDDFSLTPGEQPPSNPTATNAQATPAVVPAIVTGSNETLLSVSVAPGANPTSTNLQVTIDASAIGLSAAQEMVDDGSHGDLIPGDGVYSYRAVVADAVESGVKPLPITVTDGENRTASATAILTVNQTNPLGHGLASPSILASGDASLMTVTVTPGTHPLSTHPHVVVDLSPIGGPANQEFLDDGVDPDATADDGVFSYRATLPAGVAAGLTILDATITDEQGRSSGSEPTVSFSIDVPTPIHDIQGPGALSPMNGADLSIGGPRGIVTAIRADGFFIQQTDVDDDPRTSEGIFVSTNSLPFVKVGDLAWVFGQVEEAAPADDPNGPPVTRILASSVLVVSSGHPLPDPMSLTTTFPSAEGAIDQLESLEGMRVHVESLRVVGPTDGVVDPVEQTAASGGVFFGVVEGVARPFRTAGIPLGDPLPDGAPPNVPRFDTNPERLRIDSLGQVGAGAIDVPSGALVSNVTGPLDYAGRTYTILVDPVPAPTANGMKEAQPVRAATADEFTVASVNLGGLVDDVDEYIVDDAVASTTAIVNRIAKTSLVVRNVLGIPDIIGVQEVENLPLLEALAAKINQDAAALNPMYVAVLLGGHDPHGLNVGLLVKSSRVAVNSVEPIAADTPFDGANGFLFDRPSLLVTASVSLPTRQYPVSVIVNDLQPLDGIAAPAVQQRRKLQAEALAAFVAGRQAANPDEHLVLIGNFNAYEFNDGYVDVFGAIKGTPAAPDQVILATAPVAGLHLDDLGATVPASQRYSVVSLGNAEERDHVLISSNVNPFIAGMQWARSNADFPEVLRNDPARVERLSSHDSAVVFFGDIAPPMLTLPAPIAVEATSPAGAVVSFDAKAFDAVDGPREVTCTPASGSTFGLGTTIVACETSDLVGQTTSGTFNITVVDTSAPALSLPDPLTEVATSPSGAVVTFTATALDVVDGAVAVTCAPASGATFPVGASPVSCAASDAQGNSRAGAFIVTVTEPGTAGEMSGGGSVDAAGERHEFEFHVRERASGAEAGSIQYRIKKNQRGRESQDRFESTQVLSVSFYDLPGVAPGRRAQPTVDTVVFRGMGFWNGRSGYTFEALATDAGEGGRSRDIFAITVLDSAGRVVASINGPITNGNIQSNRLNR